MATPATGLHEGAQYDPRPPGSDFVLRDLDLWVYTAQSRWTSAGRKIHRERDHRSVQQQDKAEYLNAYWRRYYNEDRPHSGIGQIPPILLHNPGGASGPSPPFEAENSSFG